MSTRSTRRDVAGSSGSPLWVSPPKLGTCVRPTAWRSRSSLCTLRGTQPRLRCIDRTSLVSREPSLKMSSGPLRNVADLLLHRRPQSALPPKRPPSWLKLVSRFETPGTFLAFPTNGLPSSSTCLPRLGESWNSGPTGSLTADRSQTAPICALTAVSKGRPGRRDGGALLRHLNHRALTWGLTRIGTRFSGSRGSG